MKRLAKLPRAFFTLATFLLVTGCASDKPVTEKPRTITLPARIRFGEFKNAELKPFTIAEKYANHKANQQLARSMDVTLYESLSSILQNLKPVQQGTEFSKGTERTLQITPCIQVIRTYILIQVIYRDSLTGEVIAAPIFYKSGWNLSENWPKEMCRNEIGFYTLSNK